jgi:hypothetical protein
MHIVAFAYIRLNICCADPWPHVRDLNIGDISRKACPHQKKNELLDFPFVSHQVYE